MRPVKCSRRPLWIILNVRVFTKGDHSVEIYSNFKEATQGSSHPIHQMTDDGSQTHPSKLSCDAVQRAIDGDLWL